MTPRRPAIIEAETHVLAFLATGTIDYGCFSFGCIAEFTKLDRCTVRRACRSLKRRGLSEFHRGLWTDDGEAAGSGYSATERGRKQANIDLVKKYSLERYQ